ncbi:hypothetical protein GCM10025864_12470 [Luteimicrobium album]|uniref:ABC transmembrane type-1 domain-containing protein n=1 Tax=Luteimicrobium album TaxID=1054550 RepID=A0ABQ6HYB3_9MICO|nr:hypothetical protein GCM10025864_12470 [Luteimicrobium album]
MLVAPAVLLLLLFTFAPAVYAFVLSLLKVHVSGGLLGTTTERVFAGAQNYTSTLADAEFWSSLGRMLIVAAIGVPSVLFLATLFALCLDADRARMTGFSRLAIFLPYAVPGVIASLLWGFLYLPATSPIGGDVVDYFGSTTIFFAVANVAAWGSSASTWWCSTPPSVPCLARCSRPHRSTARASCRSPCGSSCP